MANDYFDPSSYEVVDGTTIDASDLNNLANAIETAFDSVETDIDTNVTNISAVTPTNTAVALYLVRRNAGNTGLEYVEPDAGVGADTFKVRLESTSTEDYLLPQLQYMGII